MSDRYEPHARSVHTEDCHYPEWAPILRVDTDGTERVSGDFVCVSCWVTVTPGPPAKVEAE